MSVYVDSMMPTASTRKWPFKASCHMFADTDEELHEMAASLRMKRSWFQDDDRLPHYDLVSTRRQEAIARGAIAITRREMVDFIRKKTDHPDGKWR